MEIKQNAIFPNMENTAVIVAHTLVADLWCMLKRQQAYVDHRDHERTARQAIECLEGLGYQVTLKPAS